MRSDHWKTRMLSAVFETFTFNDRVALLPREFSNLNRSISGPIKAVPPFDAAVSILFEQANAQADKETSKKNFDWTPEFTYNRR